jgi:tetratricopeptide (TPR) repeat protein
MSKYTKQDANKLWQEGHLEEACAAFRDIIHESPEDWKVYDALACLEISLSGNLEDAKALIEKAGNYGCPPDRYHRVCANILWRKSQFQEATDRYEQAVEIDRSVSNLAAFAHGLEAIGDNRALSIWREIVEKDSGVAQAYLGLVRYAERQKDWSEAIKMASKAKDLEPDNPEVFFRLGYSYQNLGQYEKALEYYMEAESKGFAQEYAFHSNVAFCYFELSEYTKALEHTHKAAKLKPGDSWVNERLDWSKKYVSLNLPGLIETRLYAEAYALAKVALEAWPNDSEFLAYSGVLEIAFKHNHKAGKEYIDKAFELNNVKLDVLYRIKGALLWDHLDDREEGLAYIEKAVALNPDTQNLITLASRIAETDLPRAESIYQKILQTDPDSLDAIGRSVELAFKRKDWSKALELAKRGYALRPSYPFITDFLAYAYYNLGKFEEALEYYHKTIELDHPEKAIVYHAIAECYSKLGNQKEARKYIEKALDVDPDDPEAKKMLSDLIGN